MELSRIRMEICEILEAAHPMTLRALFYQLESRHIIGKTEQAYKNLGRMLCKLREDGFVPWAWVVDNTRSLSVPTTFHNVGHALRVVAHHHRRDPWKDQDCVVYLMTEKDAIASILAQETQPYRVPLAVVRGFSSRTFLKDIADNIVANGKRASVFYFGDHDPSGLSIANVAERLLRRYAPEVDLRFVRLAVTNAQIDEYSLPTRPTKRSDKRIKSFRGDSVEVDALPMETLRTLARNAIESCLDWDRYSITIERERAERQELARMVERYDEGNDSESEDDNDDE
jgi:hypothetical protein